MMRTTWKPMGSGPLDVGTFAEFNQPQADGSGSVTSWGDLIAINQSRVDGLRDVDPITALSSKFSAMPQNARLVLAGGAALALLLVLMPTPSGNRR